MPGNVKDAALAASIHSQECYADPSYGYKHMPESNRDSRWLGAGSYRCAYRIRGVVYKVEHKWYYSGDCNRTEFANACLARALHISVVPPCSQFKVKVPNKAGKLVAMLVNAMPYYKMDSNEYRRKFSEDWYDVVERLISNTPLAHLTWDMGGSNIKFTPTGKPRIVDAANQC